MPYLVTFFVMVAFAAFLRYFGKPIIINLYVYDLDACDSSKCMGIGAVHRVSFCLFVFFAIHAIATLGRSTGRFHSTQWVTKICILLLAMVSTFFIPNYFFDLYAVFSRFVSGIFLVLQIIILVDFAYKWNESWMRDDREWKGAILTTSAIMYGVSLTLAIFYFKWFTDGDCGLNKFFISFTIITTFVATILSASSYAEHGSILASGVVTTYSYWILFSALSSDPSSCNSINSENTAGIILGCLLTCLSVTYAAWNVSSSEDLFDSDDSLLEAGAAAEPSSDAEDEAVRDSTADAHTTPLRSSSEKDPLQGGDEATRKDNNKFHIVMMMASMYVAMMLTNWAVDSDSSSVAVQLSSETMWIKIITQWTTIALYCWYVFLG